MDSVLKDTTSTTVFDDRYQLYIDTTMKIEARTYGTFVIEYDPLETDMLLKKVPALKDVKLKRDPADGSKRYLHSINKTKKEQILALRKVFNFVVTLPEGDDRLVMLDTPTLKIIEYTDKSVGFFTTDIMTLVKLREFENDKKVKYYPKLTGPGNVSMPGYLLFKSSKDYSKILQAFSGDSGVSGDSSTTPVRTADPSVKPKAASSSDNKMENIAPGPKNQVRFRIQGDTKYVDERLVEVREDYGDKITILHDKPFDGDKRELEIEIANDD